MTLMKQYNANTSLNICVFTGKRMFDGFIHSTKCNKKEEIYKDKQFLTWKKENVWTYENVSKDNTDPIPHLHL